MADFDVEAMLEAPFKEGLVESETSLKASGAAPMDEDKHPANGEADLEAGEEIKSRRDKDDDKGKNGKKERKDKDKDRSRHKDKKKSRHRSHSPSRRSRSRSASRRHSETSSRHRSRSPHRRRKSRSRSRSPRSSRHRDRDNEREKEREREREKERDRRERSRERRRKDLEKERLKEEEREKEREAERARRKERERTPESERDKKIREYMESLTEEARMTLDEPLDREKRSVVCMQLAARLRNKELAEFFESNQCGLVRDVRIISDRNSRRSKGIAYVEFMQKEGVMRAIALTGQRLQGVPIIVQYSQAEKNRQASQVQQVATVGPTRIYVGSLHFNLSEKDVETLFSPFGDVESVNLQHDAESGRSKGFGFVQFKKPESARKALEQMNGFEIGGRPIKVNWVTDRMDGNMLDDDDDENGGLSLNQNQYMQLMQRLGSRDFPGAMPNMGLGGNGLGGMAMGAMGGVIRPPGAVAAAMPVQPSQCLLLKNMFDAAASKDDEWDLDLKEDVQDEAGNYGRVLHVAVDKNSPQGCVYVKFAAETGATKAQNAMNGRWFDGKMIIAEYIPLSAYQARYPAA